MIPKKNGRSENPTNRRKMTRRAIEPLKSIPEERESVREFLNTFRTVRERMQQARNVLMMILTSMSNRIGIGPRR